MLDDSQHSFSIYVSISLLESPNVTLCILLLGVDSALTIEQGGMTTNESEYCIGAQLTFRCTLAASSYDWVVTGFLDGSVGNGKITIETNETVGEFMLSASGIDDTRMTSLQITVFQGLVGVRTIKCRETGTTIGGVSDTITVLGESIFMIHSL